MSETLEYPQDLQIKKISGLSKFLVKTPVRDVLFIEATEPERDYDNIIYMHYKFPNSVRKEQKAREVVIFTRGSGRVRHAQLIENARYADKLGDKMAQNLLPTGGGKITRDGEHSPSKTYGSPEYRDEGLVNEVFFKTGLLRNYRKP